MLEGLWRDRLEELKALAEAEERAVDGPARLVRFGWAAVGPGEAVLTTGTNVAGTDLDGRFRWLTGFWDPNPERPEPPDQA